MQAAPIVSMEKKTGLTHPVRVRGRNPGGTSVGAANPHWRQKLAGGWICPQRGHQRTGDIGFLVRALNPDSQTQPLCAASPAETGVWP
jgi:hypothetical protein